MSTGPGEATLLTTVVSLDPMYAAFDVDEQSFLRYGTSGEPGQARERARSPGCRFGMALAGDEEFPQRAR